jgi:monooxygenase
LENKIEETVDLLVVGAGHAGLALALDLSRDGHEIAIVEKGTRVTVPYQGIDLQPNGLAVLDRLGVLEATKAAGWPHRHWLFYETGGKYLADWDYGILDHPQNFAVGIRPHVLKEIMIEELKKRKNVAIHWGTTFERAERIDDGKRLRITATRDSQPLSITTRMMVGADGPFSVVRKFAGIDSHVKFYPNAWAEGVFPRPSGRANEGMVYFGRGIYMGIVATSANELATFQIIYTKDIEELKRTRDVQAMRKEMVDIAPELRDVVADMSSWEQLKYIPAPRMTCDAWVADNVALAGDAAHTVHQLTSQGANLALQDGSALAARLRDCFAKGDFSKKSLMPYEQDRRPAVEQIQRLGDEFSRTHASRSWIVSGMNLRAQRNLDKKPEIKRRFLMYATGLRRADRPFTLSERLQAIGI